MKEDVKNKIFSSPSRGDLRLVIYIQPRLLPGGVYDLAALHRRVVQRRRQPQVILLTYWFHVSVALDADQLRSYASHNVGF
jgi:hypothetical protein